MEVGVASKVANLLSTGLVKKKLEKINLDEPLEWETITSAANPLDFYWLSSLQKSISKLIFVG